MYPTHLALVPRRGVGAGPTSWAFASGQSITFQLTKTMALPAWAVANATQLQNRLNPSNKAIIQINNTLPSYTVTNFSSTPTSMTFTLTASGQANLSQTGLLNAVGGSGVTVSTIAQGSGITSAPPQNVTTPFPGSYPPKNVTTPAPAPVAASTGLSGWAWAGIGVASVAAVGGAAYALRAHAKKNPLGLYYPAPFGGRPDAERFNTVLAAATYGNQKYGKGNFTVRFEESRKNPEPQAAAAPVPGMAPSTGKMVAGGLIGLGLLAVIGGIAYAVNASSQQANTTTNYLAVINDPATVKQYQSLVATNLAAGDYKSDIQLTSSSYAASDVDGNPSNPKWVSTLAQLQAYINSTGELSKAGNGLPAGFPTSLRTDGVLDLATAILLAGA